jgi:hypothetical protein
MAVAQEVALWLRSYNARDKLIVEHRLTDTQHAQLLYTGRNPVTGKHVAVHVRRLAHYARRQIMMRHLSQSRQTLTYPEWIQCFLEAGTPTIERTFGALVHTASWHAIRIIEWIFIVSILGFCYTGMTWSVSMQASSVGVCVAGAGSCFLHMGKVIMSQWARRYAASTDPSFPWNEQNNHNNNNNHHHNNDSQSIPPMNAFQLLLHAQRPLSDSDRDAIDHHSAQLLRGAYS